MLAYRCMRLFVGERYIQRVFSTSALYSSVSTTDGSIKKKKFKELSKKPVNEGKYYQEFMKILRNQREPPFIYAFIGSSLESINLKTFEKAFKKVHGENFVSYGIKSTLVSDLKNNGITKPLMMQQHCLPDVLNGNHTIIESATGSGKTLVFLLPILNDTNALPCSNIIIVPTRELASQIYKEALKYVEDRFDVARLVSGIDEDHERNLKTTLRNAKILIGTPKRLLEVIENNSGHFRKVKRIILDEVDKLLPFTSVQKAKKNRISKLKPSEKILGLTLSRNRSTQLIATSATISHILIDELKDLGFTRTPSVHKLLPDRYMYGQVPPNIKNLFTIAPGSDDLNSKLHLCVRLFVQRKQTSVLVFIHRDESVEKAVEEIIGLGFTAKSLYKELLQPSPVNFERFLKEFKDGDVQFVVSNEETVRGLDFPFVDSVYIAYVPETPEAYVHVAGRVGRLDNRGTALTILSEENKIKEKRHLKRRYFLLGIKGKYLDLNL